MRARRIIATIEIDTDLSLKELAQHGVWMAPQAKPSVWDVRQVHVNVANPKAQNMLSSRKPWSKPRKLAKKA